MIGRKETPTAQVVGICPECGADTQTAAMMTAEALKRFDRTLAVYCRACRKGHACDREHLRLATDT